MKRQSAAEKQAKQPSPSKRRWSSKVTEILGRTLDRHANHEKSSEEAADEKYYLNPTIVSGLLKAAESLVPLSELEGLLDEAGVLSLPAHNDNLKKLQELKTLVTILQKDLEQIASATQATTSKSKATDLKLSKCVSLLRRVVNLGVSVHGSTNLVAWVMKHLACLECLPSGASYERLTSVLSETEKIVKQFDSEVIDLLHKKRDRFKKLLAKSEELLKIPQLCLINEETLHKLLKESREQGLENAEPIMKVQGVVDLIHRIRSLAALISSNPSGRIVNELDPTTQEDLSETVQNAIFSLKGLLNSQTSQELVDLLKEGSTELRSLATTLGLDDPDLSNLIAKMESVVWKHKAKLVLANPDESEEEFSKLLQTTPADIVSDGCREYSQIKERVHAFQAALLNEKRITEMLESYWEDENLGAKLPEVSRFVQESKGFIFKEKKIERKLDILEQVARAFHNIVGTKNKEDLVDELRDLRLENTKVYHKLSGIASTSEKAENHAKYFRKTKAVAQKFRTNLAEQLTVRILREVPKMKLAHAKEISSFLKGLPAFLKGEYESDLAQLEADLTSIQGLSQEFDTQISKAYPRNKFLEQKLSAEEVKSCTSKLNSIVRKVFVADVRDEALEQKMADLDVFVRAVTLLDRSIDAHAKRDFSSWENISECLREIAKDERCSLLVSMTNKIKSAEKIMIEVRRMKQFESQFNQTTNKAVPLKIITRQNKMPRLEEAKELLRTYERECKEIELDDTAGTLRSWIESCEDKLTAASSPKTQISDLLVLIEQLRKTPINIEAQVAELNDKILRAQDFDKKVKTRSAEQLEYEMQPLREEYSKLSVKIPEFERVSEQFSAERYRCQTLEESFEKLGLSDLMKVRQELMHQKFFRDRTLEVKLLVKIVNLLEEELIRISSGYDDEIDMPLIDALALESLNKELNEIKRSSKFSSFASKGGFLSKLVGELKQYLQEKIYVLDLEGLSRLRSKCFRKIIDIRKEITDHKIKLEIVAKSGDNKLAANFEQRVDDSRKFDAFGMFGNQPALISRMDREVAPSTTSHPAGHMDWNQSTGFDRRGATDSNQMNEEAVGGKKTKEKLLGALVSSIEREPRKRRPDGTYQDPKKPDMSSGTITRQLRQFFCNGFKYWLERNEHFEITGLDSLMAANTLEKQIYEKYPEKVTDYDTECEAIGKVLRNLCNMKYLSTHIRNRSFRLGILLKLIDKDKIEIRKIDGFAKTKLDKSKSKPEDGEIKVVEEDDELLENIGDLKQIEEQNLQFSDAGSDVEEELENDQEVPVPPPRFSRAPRALSYDPETGQYQVVKNRFLPGQVQDNYMYYSIFKGNAFFETTDKPDPKRKPERARFYSCAEDEFIRYFTEVPDGIQFHPQLTKLEFEQYIQKCLISEVAENYLVLPIWIESPSHLSMKSFYKNNDCVGSIQYSPRCKLFVFPKEYLRSDWFNIINFNFVKRDQTQVELVGFIVLKLTNADTSAYEPPIIPEAVKVDKTHRAFKFLKKGHELVEKPFDIENLREKLQNLEDSQGKEDGNGAANPRFLEELIDEQEERADAMKGSRAGVAAIPTGPAKKKTKLERLMTNDIGGLSVATPAGFEAHSEMFSGDPFGGRITPGPLPGLPVRGGKDSVSTQMLGGMLPKRAGPSTNNINDLDSDDDDRLSSPGELEDKMLGKRQQQPFQQAPPGFQQFPHPSQHQMNMGGHQMQAQIPGGHFQQQQQYGQPQQPAGFSNFAPNSMRGGMGGQNPRFQGNQGGYPAHPSDFNSMNQSGHRGGFGGHRGGPRGGMDRGNRGGFQDGGFNSRGRGGNNMMGAPRGRGGFQQGGAGGMGQAPPGMSGFDMSLMDAGNAGGQQNQMPQAVGFGAPGGAKPQQGGYGGQSRGGAPQGFHTQGGGFQGNSRGGHERGGFRGGNDRGGRGSFGGNRGFQGGMGGSRGGFNQSGQMGQGYHGGGGRGGYNQNQEMSGFGGNNAGYGQGFQGQRGGRGGYGAPGDHMGGNNMRGGPRQGGFQR